LKPGGAKKKMLFCHGFHKAKKKKDMRGLRGSDPARKGGNSEKTSLKAGQKMREGRPKRGGQSGARQKRKKTSKQEETTGFHEIFGILRRGTSDKGLKLKKFFLFNQRKRPRRAWTEPTRGGKREKKYKRDLETVTKRERKKITHPRNAKKGENWPKGEKQESLPGPKSVDFPWR